MASRIACFVGGVLLLAWMWACPIFHGRALPHEDEILTIILLSIFGLIALAAFYHALTGKNALGL